jgi:hypothetical protein
MRVVLGMGSQHSLMQLTLRTADYESVLHGRHADAQVLMPSTRLTSPQVVSRSLASFRVVGISVSAGQGNFGAEFDSRHLHF